MLIRSINGITKPRFTNRSHVWKQPSEGVVAGLIGEESLDIILRGSIGLGKPVQIANMPQVYAYNGGLVTTPFGDGWAWKRQFREISDLHAKYEEAQRRWEAEIDERIKNGERIIAGATGGFADLGDILSHGSIPADNENRPFVKLGATGVVGVGSSLWRLGSLPAAGSVGAALAGGTELDRTSTGALGQSNATSGYTKHIVGAFAQALVLGNVMMVSDRIWNGAPAMNSSSTQTVTISGGLNRYNNTIGSAIGNMAVMEVGGTVLAATAHNNTITYKDQAGNTAEAAAAFAGRSAAAVDTYDHPVNGALFIPLNAGDTGISDITVYQSSAAVATGVMNLVILHPLMFIPTGAAYNGVLIDGINSDVNLERIYDDACIAFSELAKPTTTATTYAGSLRMIQGNAA